MTSASPSSHGPARRTLPLGVQSFRKLHEDGRYYVDKTPHIERLLEHGGVYFLSRLRRFGKSLLVDTLAELFQGGERTRGRQPSGVVSANGLTGYPSGDTDDMIGSGRRGWGSGSGLGDANPPQSRTHGAGLSGVLGRRLGYR